jgi:hypothetical protein
MRDTAPVKDQPACAPALDRLEYRGVDRFGGGVLSVAFSPDGSLLASVDGTTVRVWALDIDDLLDVARQNVTRLLTDEECRQYLHQASCSAGHPDTCGSTGLCERGDLNSHALSATGS